MIRTETYIIVKKHGNKWVPIKQYCGKSFKEVQIYSLRDAIIMLKDFRSGDMPGHSRTSVYKIAEICYCDLLRNKN
jgi:hypothetical protein